MHLPGRRAHVDLRRRASATASEGVPLVVIAGAEYGAGSSRDWAAKGTRLLGVRAVIAESFERIHRSNLVGMGVLPLQFPAGVTRKTLELEGSEIIDISGRAGAAPRMQLDCTITRADGRQRKAQAAARASTPGATSNISATAACCTTCCGTAFRTRVPHESKEKTARAARRHPLCHRARRLRHAHRAAGAGRRVRGGVPHRRRLFARQRLSRHRAADA